MDLAALAQAWSLDLPLTPGLRLLALFGAWALASWVVVWVFRRVVVARAQATASPWDDLLAKAAQGPLYAGLLAGGVAVLTTLPETAAAGWTDAARTAAWVLLALALAHGALVFSLGVLARRAARDAKVAGIHGTLAFALRLVVWSIALMTVLLQLGVTITPLLGFFGLGGLAVALAMQDTLSNFFAGVSLRLDRPLVEGDLVDIDGGAVRGRVVEVSWRSVRIHDLGGNIIQLPNGRVATSVVRTSRRSLTVPLTLAYGNDLEAAEAIAVEVAAEALHAVGGPDQATPFVRFRGFSDQGVDVTIVLPVGPSIDHAVLTHEFVKALHERFAREGLSIRHLPTDLAARRARGDEARAAEPTRPRRA